MNVYNISYPYFESKELAMQDRAEDISCFTELTGSPMLATWVPRKYRLTNPAPVGTRGYTGVIHDYIPLMTNILTISENALLTLLPLIKSCAEILPLDVPRHHVYYINPLTTVDAIDYVNSEVTYFENTTLINKFIKYVLYEHLIPPTSDLLHTVWCKKEAALLQSRFCRCRKYT
jgi:hypothetical protein